MRRHRRSLEVVVRVGALLNAVAWARSGQSFDRVGTVLLLIAVSGLSVQPVRSGRWQRPLTIVSYLVIGVVTMVVIGRAWPFAPTVLAVWAGAAAVPTVAWVCWHPAIRQALGAWLRSDPAEASRDRVVTTGR